MTSCRSRLRGTSGARRAHVARIHAATSANPRAAAARRAFTLIEMVATTALSALLLTVALSVVRTVNRPPTTTDAATDTAGPVARQLQWDLANGVVLRTDDHGLTLAGYGSLDPTTMEPTHQPTLITYTLRPVADSLWLAREQTPLNTLANGTTSTELLCGGVARFVLDAPPSLADQLAATRPAEEDPTPLPFQRLAHVRPVPSRVRVTVTFTRPGEPPVEVMAYR